MGEGRCPFNSSSLCVESLRLRLGSGLIVKMAITLQWVINTYLKNNAEFLITSIGIIPTIF